MNLNSKEIKNILFLTPRIPFPLIGGDRIKSYNLLAYLGKNYNTSLVTFYQGKNSPDEYIQELEKLGIKVYMVPLNPLKAAFKSSYFTKLISPLEIKFYTQPEFAKTVNRLIKNENFDLAFSFFMRTAEYLKDAKLKKVLIAEDCRVLYQYRSFKESSNLIQKIVRLYEYLTLKKYEPEIVNKFDITTLVTNNDIEAIKKSNPNAQYRLLTNGTIINESNLHNFDKRSGMVFCGKLDVWANIMNVRRITDEIFPLIKEKVPNAVFNIVGANPIKEIQKLASDDIRIFPNVPDTRVYMQNASLFLHPHNGGTGIQNKLLEAMSCGCPVVTTPIGNQGIDGTHLKNIMIGSSSIELANAAIKILTEAEFAKNIGENGRQLMIETHSWDSIFTELEKIIKELEK